jgi:hypothetical protein
VDRFEWEDSAHWHNSGLWDYAISPEGMFNRVLNAEYAAELLACQLHVSATLGKNAAEELAIAI